MRRVFFIIAIFLLASGRYAHGFAVNTQQYDPAYNGGLVIVIDPGHGGTDSGATGQGAVKEKDINLNIARELGKALKEKLNIEPLFTRTEDTNISLRERTEAANKANADIFISIHANAAKRTAASGIETYFLSLEASDEDARMAAAFENRAVEINGNPDDETTDVLKSILWDLTQSDVLRKSAMMAERIHNSLVDALGGENRGVKQAPFMVLVGATMPAVLIEVGFISNPEEEKNLNDPVVQTTIAKAIAKGVSDFDAIMNKIEGYAGGNTEGDALRR